PQLPRRGRTRRPARPRARRRGHAAHRRPVVSPGAARRRQHAGVWQRALAGGNHRAGALPGNPAPELPASGSRRVARRRSAWRNSAQHHGPERRHADRAEVRTHSGAHNIKAVILSGAGQLHRPAESKDLLLFHASTTMHALLAIFDADAALPSNLWAAWSFPIVPFAGIALLLAVYLRGWFAARRTRTNELPAWRLACFLSGLAFLWIALASPIDALDDYLLAAHMIQHFILMSIAPPLIVLGAPTVPLLRGLPRSVIRLLSRPLFRSGWAHRLGRLLTHPVFAFVAMNTAYLGWHVPAMFELTFRSERIHDLEHLCFFLTSVAFWWVVIEPWPTASRWPRWTAI